MPSTPDDLVALLGGPPPPTVAALAAEDREALAALVRAAQRRQSHELAANAEVAIRKAPLPVRGILKKVLLG